MNKHIYLFVAVVASLLLSACTDKIEEPKPIAADDTFTVAAAMDNLSFAKNQYLKLIDHVNNKRYLTFQTACKQTPEMICVPRAEEHDGIYMARATQWTNGFFPGLLWKLLSAKHYIESWHPNEEQTLFDTATFYQEILYPETKRGATHDLGFILYDSFGEALSYEALSDETRQEYLTALATGRATLATRYQDDIGLIKSWDWTPEMKLGIVENGSQVIKEFAIDNPWTYPVIVDNMMNLEFLLDSDIERYHEIAFNHAKQTKLNHYFFDESDTQQQFPIAYHVFDYGSMKPGNWQGVGNVSAWARGQAWSLYGFVTIVEAMEKTNIDLTNYPDFESHLKALVGTVQHLLEPSLVPYWDYFANRPNAYEYAENVSSNTTVFHGILNLCSKRVEETIKPYEGHRPMTLNSSILSEESIAQLQGVKNWYGSDIIQGDKFYPCGTEAYPSSHTKIPRDTSAAAIYAAALYRLAGITKDRNEKLRYVSFADSIMHELSEHYRTDRTQNGRPNSVDYGFVLAEATGDFGNGGEIDTPIIYGDFYFIEANIRKIELEQDK